MIVLPKSIYWFAYYGLDSPSVRYRGYYPLEYLKEKYGVNYKLITPSYSIARIWAFVLAYSSALFSSGEHTLIVVQRVHSNFIYANLLKLLVWLRSNICVYDIDDADHLEFPDKNIRWFIQNSAVFNAGSLQLKETFSDLQKHVEISTSPTVDLGIEKTKRNDKFHIGWIGFFGGGHKRSLLRDVFPALLQLPFSVKLSILGVHKLGGINSREEEELGAYFKDADHIELDIPSNINWLDENEIQQRISQFDVGIATLIDDEFHRSKSGFKAKQYLNNGVPVLSSAIPENTTFVKDGYNGYLCASAEEYLQKLIILRQMPNVEYFTLSKNALSSTDTFNHNAYAKSLSMVYKTVCQQTTSGYESTPKT